MGRGNGHRAPYGGFLPGQLGGDALAQALAARRPFSLTELAAQVPEIARLAECPQDAAWHAEGDVLRHTELALADLWRRVAGQDPRWPVLTAAVLLHDIGKPAVTRSSEETGRIVSYDHERAGVPIAREMLRRAGWSGDARDEVLKLVLWHMRPRALTEETPHDSAFVRLALETDIDDLVSLLEADRRGRESADVQTDWERTVERFCEPLRRLDLTGGAFFDVSDDELAGIGFEAADFAYARGALAYAAWDGQVRGREAARSFLHDLRRAGPPHGTLYLLAGAPGSGKSTWARERGYRTVSTDDIRERTASGTATARQRANITTEARLELKELVREGGDIVYDATNVEPKRRRLPVDLARRYRMRVIGVSFDAPPDEVLMRNRSRREALPDDIVRSYLDALVPFTRYEVDEVLRPLETPA